MGGWDKRKTNSKMVDLSQAYQHLYLTQKKLQKEDINRTEFKSKIQICQHVVYKKKNTLNIKTQTGKMIEYYVRIRKEKMLKRHATLIEGTLA